MTTCAKTGCNQRTFMADERCFDHRRESLGFRIYFGLCLLLGLALVGVGVWAVISLVNWVVAQ